MTNLHKRTQKERMFVAASLLSSVWEDFENGDIDTDILQVAVYCQIDINRIVWELNQVGFKDDTE